MRDAHSLVARLQHDHKVNQDAIGVWFSGSKGFSVEIPAAAFGPKFFGPLRASELAERFGAVAFELAQNLTTVDYSIYSRMRLWRWPGFPH